MSSMMPDVKEVLITSQEIEEKVREIGARIIKDLEEDITDRHVLIVEDIIDTGLTLSYLRRSLLARGPASLEICALLSKTSRRRTDLDVRYLGFEVPDEFVVGYGLDYAGTYRNLPDICILKPEVFATG